MHVQQDPRRGEGTDEIRSRTRYQQEQSQRCSDGSVVRLGEGWPCNLRAARTALDAAIDSMAGGSACDLQRHLESRRFYSPPVSDPN